MINCSKMWDCIILLKLFLKVLIFNNSTTDCPAIFFSKVCAFSIFHGNLVNKNQN